METFSQFTDIATPLALAGLALAVLFFIFRRILKLKMERLPHGSVSKILLRVVNFLFILALVAMVLGFAGYVIDLSKPDHDADHDNDLASRKVTLGPSNKDLPSLLQSCAMQVGAVLALDKRLQGQISIRAVNSPLRDILNQICELKKCTWEIQEGNPPALLVRLDDPVRP